MPDERIPTLTRFGRETGRSPVGRSAVAERATGGGPVTH